MPKSNNTKPVINRQMNLGELVQIYPELAAVLQEDYGLHCVGCMAADFDSLEQGAKVHGFDDKEIDKMVKRLNQIISKDKLTARAE